MNKWRPSRTITVAAMLLMAGLTLGVLGILLWRDRELLLSHDWQVRWEPLAAAFGIYSLGLLLAAAVWADIMAALGSRLGTTTHIRYYCITHLGKRLPGTLWYLAGRGYLYGRHGDSLGLVTVASGLELAGLVVAGGAVSVGFLAGSWLEAAGGRGWMVAVLMAFGLALMHPRILRWAALRVKVEIPAELRMARLLRWAAGYALIWMSGGVIVYWTILALLPLEGGHLAYVIGAWTLVGVLSMTVLFLPSNLGFTEVGLSLLLARILPPSFAVFVAIFVRILILAFEIAGVGIVLLVTYWRARRIQQPTTPPSPAP